MLNRHVILPTKNMLQRINYPTCTLASPLRHYAVNNTIRNTRQLLCPSLSPVNSKCIMPLHSTVFLQKYDLMRDFRLSPQIVGGLGSSEMLWGVG
jgi:hypothetical protein